MIKQLLVTSLILSAIPTLGSAAASAAADVKISAASASASASALDGADIIMTDADQKRTAARGQMNNPKRVQQAKVMITRGNRGSFYQFYFEWDLMHHLSDADRKEVLTFFFANVKPPLPPQELSELNYILNQMRKNHDMWDVLNHVMHGLPECWLKDENFMKATAPSRAVVSQPQHPQPMDVVSQPALAPASALIFPAAWHALHPYALVEKIVAQVTQTNKEADQKNASMDSAEQREEWGRKIFAHVRSGLKQIKGLSEDDYDLIKILVMQRVCPFLVGSKFYDWAEHMYEDDIPYEDIPGDPELATIICWLRHRAFYTGPVEDRSPIFISAMKHIMNATPQQYAAVAAQAVQTAPTYVGEATNLLPELAHLVTQYSAHRPLGVSIAQTMTLPHFREACQVPAGRLGSLGLSGCMIDDCCGLEAFRTLDRLDLSRNLLTRIPVALLPRTLRTLIVSENSGLVFDDAQQTQQRPTVTALFMEYIDHLDLAAIARIFPNVREVSLRGADNAERLPDDWLESWTQLENVKPNEFANEEQWRMMIERRALRLKREHEQEMLALAVQAKGK